MFEIDHSIVFRRNDGSSGSGTVIHFTATFIVLEVYENDKIHLNEVFRQIRISHGRSIIYDGNGIVRHVKDYSSLQIIDLYLLDSWIALSNEDLDADNRFEAERFLELYTKDCKANPKWSLCFFRFIHLLSQMMTGLRRIGTSTRMTGDQLTEDSQRDVIGKKMSAIDLMVEKLHTYYDEFDRCLQDCDDKCQDQIDSLFRQLLFPLSRHSRIFRLFHCPTRIPYLNYRKLSKMNDREILWNGSLRGVLLDLFFFKFVGVQTLEQRCSHFLGKIESMLEEREGDIRILFIGTDFTPLQIVKTFSLSLLSRLEIEVTSFFKEPVEEFLDHISVASATKDIGIRFDYYPTELGALIRDYFCQTGSRLETYDLICISSLIDTLSENTLPYLIHYLVNHLRKGGELNLFTAANQPSSVCDHWLQWYTRPLDQTEWDRLLPNTITWKEKPLECGTLVTVCQSADEE